MTTHFVSNRSQKRRLVDCQNMKLNHQLDHTMRIELCLLDLSLLIECQGIQGYSTNVVLRLRGQLERQINYELRKRFQFFMLLLTYSIVVSLKTL